MEWSKLDSEGSFHIKKCVPSEEAAPKKCVKSEEAILLKIYNIFNLLVERHCINIVKGWSYRCKVEIHCMKTVKW